MKAIVWVLGFGLLYSVNAQAAVISFEYFSTFFEGINAFLDTVYQFFVEDVVGWVIEAVEWFMLVSLKVSMLVALKTLEISWDLSKQMIADLAVFSRITSYWNALPDMLRDVLGLARVPESLSIISTAYMTRFVLGMTK
jgi:hypothetical protein